MGEVYEAWDSELGSRVAVKTILPALARDAGVVERFRREVLLARRVTHPNVCRVFELFSSETPAGEPLKFLTMEFLEGESLAHRLKRGPMSAAEALPLVRQVVAALQAAHAQGIVHRDFKPGNVMLVPADGAAGDSGEVRAVVTDFGIARALALAPEKEGTQTGAVVGTPRYMAPEQLAGGAVTPATDIYALGLVMHEMVTGKLPGAADTGDTVEEAHPRELPEPRTPRLESRWSAAVARCLAPEADQRFQSVLDVVAALEVPRRSMKSRWAAGTLLATAALAALSWVAVHRLGGRTVPTLAVLPFRSIGGEPAEHFGLGLTDAVVGRLATSRKLTVRPTSAVQRFEQERADAIEVGRQLGVDQVVEGTIRRIEGGTRVLVQLTDVGRRAVVWSDQLDLPVGRLFELEDAITTRLVDRLRIKLDASRQTVPVSDRIVEKYLATSAHLGDAHTPPADNARALVAQLDAILAEEPNFAPAIAARAYAGAFENFYAPNPARAEAALRDARQALRLDPELPLAHVAQAVLFWSPWGGWKFAETVHELRTAIEISPGFEIARFELQRTFQHRGWFREAREEQQQIRRLNPFSYDVARATAAMVQYEGQARQAVELFRQLPPPPRPTNRLYERTWMSLARLQLRDPSLKLDELEGWVQAEPRQELLLSVLAIARAQAGAPGIADLEQRILALDPNVGHFHHAVHNLGLARAQLGDTAGAVAYLRRAAETGMACLPCFENDPFLTSVRGTQEYAVLRADLLRDENEVRARLKALEESASARPR
jgi:serine/threonine-protein kinase